MEKIFLRLRPQNEMRDGIGGWLELPLSSERHPHVIRNENQAGPKISHAPEPPAPHRTLRFAMALSLASSPSPGAALPAPRVAHFALPLLPLRSPRRLHQARLRLRLRVAASSPPEAQAAAPVAEEGEEQGEKRRKLYVANLPWSFPAPEIEKLFTQHGTVKDVEVGVGGAIYFRDAMPRALESR